MAWSALQFAVLGLYLTSLEAVKGSCEEMDIVDREDWNARPFWRAQELKTPVSHVIIIHTVTTECHNRMACSREVKFMQDYHLDNRGFWDIAYNFLVGGDGRIYIGRGWRKTGSHSINFNTISIGLAFIGNYMEVAPNKTMLRAADNLLKCGAEKGFITPTAAIHGHRDVDCTESPGDRLYEIIRQWKNFKGGRIQDYYCQAKPKPVHL